MAQQLRYEPLATLDADITLPTRLKVTGDEICKRLVGHGLDALNAEPSRVIETTRKEAVAAPSLRV